MVYQRVSHTEYSSLSDTRLHFYYNLLANLSVNLFNYLPIDLLTNQHVCLFLSSVLWLYVPTIFALLNILLSAWLSVCLSSCRILTSHTASIHWCWWNRFSHQIPFFIVTGPYFFKPDLQSPLYFGFIISVVINNNVYSKAYFQLLYSSSILIDSLHVLKYIS